MKSNNTFDFATRSLFTAGLTTACLAGLLGGNVSDAQAQPSPFDAYEGKKQVEQAKKETAPVAAQAPVVTPPTPAVVPDAMINQTGQGQWVFDVRTAFSSTLSSNETVDNDTVRNSTFFARLSPGVGYFIMENLEVGGSVGVMWRRIARSESDFSTSRDLLMEARGRYHVKLNSKFSLIPGVTLGGYVGTSQREVPVEGRDVSEETRTFGGAATLSFDAGYVINERVALNAGVGVIGLIGNETVESVDDRFRVSTLNSSLNIGIVYAF